MDTRLRIVERLYAEGDENHVPRPTHSEEGDDLGREYQAMSQAKFWMDHRRRQRPDAATVDRVVAAAAAATRGEIPGVMRPDRSPLRLLASPRVRLAVAATLVVGVVGLGVWRVALEPDAPVEAASELEESHGTEPNAVRQPRPADQRLAEAEPSREEGSRSQGKAAASRPSLAYADRDAAGETTRHDLADDSSMLVAQMAAPAPEPAGQMAAGRPAATEWDELDELVRLHQRIDRLRLRQVDEGWDRPMVPLEQMPVGSRPSSLRQAGSSGN
jgi:hypothetical protein